MRAIFVSDLHAALKLPMAKVDPGGVSSDRLRDVLEIFHQIGRYIDKSCLGSGYVPPVFIAGDLFDQQKPDGATLVATSRALQELTEIAPVYILPGNHDAVDRDGRLYNVQLYEELKIPGLRVLGHETVELDDGLLVHAVPWLPEARAEKRIRARAQKLSSSDCNVLLFHQSMLGALWDSGRPSEEGLSADVLDGFTLGVTGHFHRHQRFCDNGYYCGSPLDLRFGDEEMDIRCFWEADFSDPKKVRVVSQETVYPRFCTVRFEASEQHELELDPEKYFNGSSYVRIIVTGTARAIDKQRKVLQQYVEQGSEYGVRLVKLDLRPEREQRQRLKVGPGQSITTMSLTEVVTRYGREHAPEGIDPVALAELGARLLEG